VSIQCSLPSMVTSRMAWLPAIDGTSGRICPWSSVLMVTNSALMPARRIIDGQQLTAVLAVTEAIGADLARQMGRVAVYLAGRDVTNVLAQPHRQGAGLLRRIVRPFVTSSTIFATSPDSASHFDAQLAFETTDFFQDSKSSRRPWAAVLPSMAGCRPATAAGQLTVAQ